MDSRFHRVLATTQSLALIVLCSGSKSNATPWDVLRAAGWSSPEAIPPGPPRTHVPLLCKRGQGRERHGWAALLACSDAVPLLQGHALFARHAGGTNPCPAIDFTGGFNQFYAAAFGLPITSDAVAKHFGRAFDPFENDETFILSMWALEEIGARSNKVRTNAQLWDNICMCAAGNLPCTALQLDNDRTGQQQCSTSRQVAACWLPPQTGSVQPQGGIDADMVNTVQWLPFGRLACTGTPHLNPGHLQQE